MANAVVGMGTVLVTLFLLSKLIGLFGRVMGGADGPAAGREARGAAGAAAGRRWPSREGRERREAARVAAVAAAISAYMEAQARRQGRRPVPFTVRAVRKVAPVPWREAFPPSTWALAGRVDIMRDRGAFGVRSRISRRILGR
jgi:Na+-transporting methylmalonyl-CoA/oxaloacetate decarboxylase gamma subunit